MQRILAGQVFRGRGSGEGAGERGQQGNLDPAQRSKTGVWDGK